MWDEAEYAAIGRSVLRGEGFSIAGRPNALRPPLLPLAAAASMAIAWRQDDRAVHAAQVALCLATLLVVYLCAAATLGIWAGLAAALFLGIAPEFSTATVGFLSENAFMGPFAGAVLCLHLGLARDPRFLAGSWLCFAVALLVRYTALLFFPVAAITVAIELASRNRAIWSRLRSRPSLLGAGAAALLLAPWFLRQQLTFGDALIGVKQASRQLQIYMPAVSMPWHFYLTRLPRMVSPVPLVAAGVGAAWAVARRDRPGILAGLSMLFLLTWFSVYRFKEPRLASSVLPFVAVLAAAGLRALPLHGLGRARTPSLAAGLALLLVVNLVAARTAIARTVTLGHPSFLDAMTFLRENTTGDVVVAGSNRPQIAWYADRRVVDLPAAERALPARLAQVAWAIVTNFERGQPAYLPRLVERASPRLARSDIRVFRDKRFMTVLVRGPALRALLPLPP